MLSTSTIILALSALSSALPALTPRQAPCPSPIPPSSYHLSPFMTFTPSAGNPVPASVYFNFDDNLGVRATCDADSADNSGILLPCSNANISFFYENSDLTIAETYLPCSDLTETATITSVLELSTYCYPSEAGTPNGPGTECQIPSVSLSSYFDASTIVYN